MLAKYLSADDFPKNSVKGALPGLRQLLAAESPLKMIKNVKNAFYFTSKAPFVLKFLS